MSLSRLWAVVPPLDEFMADLRYTPPVEADIMPPEYSHEINHKWFSAKDGYDWTRWTSLNWHLPFTAVAVYCVALVGLSSSLRGATGLNIRRTLLAWNFGLAAFSCVGMVVTVPHLLFGPNSGLAVSGFYTSVCSHPMNYGAGWSGLFVMLFIYSKFIELVDTVWLVLKKRPLTILHVWHHITVLLYCWHSYATRIGTGLWFAAMNYLVHAVMYTYFGVTAHSVEARRSVKPYAVAITLLQLSQMVVGIVVTMAAMLYKADGRKCHVNSSNSVLGLTMYASYFVLFLEFFIRNNCVAKTTTESKDKIE